MGRTGTICIVARELTQVMFVAQHMESKVTTVRASRVYRCLPHSLTDESYDAMSCSPLPLEVLACNHPHRQLYQMTLKGHFMRQSSTIAMTYAITPPPERRRNGARDYNSRNATKHGPDAIEESAGQKHDAKGGHDSGDDAENGANPR